MGFVYLVTPLIYFRITGLKLADILDSKTIHRDFDPENLYIVVNW